MKKINPIIGMDYPDPDVIRVDNTYYMISTTMHFVPGGEILKSNDLIHWEHASFIFDRLEDADTMNRYGKGMWAASLRYHKGVFYACFVIVHINKTLIYTSDKIDGEWEKHEINIVFHDPSLLFDEDKLYIAYGNRDIYITELEKDLSGPKKDGFHKMVLSDSDNKMLGYEGSHFYKINGYYYLFLIHSRKDRWKRVQACFYTKNLNDAFVGGDVFENNLGFNDSGVAQGGVVETRDGRWVSILFQDRGAVGRIPVIIPIQWPKSTPLPVYLEPIDGKMSFNNNLVGSDNFSSKTLKPIWQFNHNPDFKYIKLQKDSIEITTKMTSMSLVDAPNIITQRTKMPSGMVEVTVDGSKLKEGDYAGICILQGDYGTISLTRKNGILGITGIFKESEGLNITNFIPVEQEKVVFHVETIFDEKKDESFFYYVDKNNLVPVGDIHPLHFKLDHFTGARFGLFCYATKEIGGSASFSHFVYI